MPRLQSLDIFRGLTIALMILVNTPGDGRFIYGPLRHAEWHGWTPTDCVFPSFVWIVGVAISVSLKSRPGIHKDILRRAAILFGLGLLIYAFPAFPLDTFRILGVLQRIAICYAAAAFLSLHTGVRGQIGATLALLAGYWAIMSMGDFTVEGNIAHAVDRAILGAHNYSETKTWDPEGIVSTLPAIATCLLGLLAGRVVRSPQRLLIAGVVLVVAGLALDPFHPINKKLWTVSFTLLMAGLDFVILGALVWLVDLRQHAALFRPAMIMGRNAIALYLSSEFIEITLNYLHWKQPIYESLFLPLASPINASLLYAVTYTLFHLGLAYLLFKRNRFFRA